MKDAPGKMLQYWQFRLKSEVVTVGSSGKRQQFRLSAVSANVGTSGRPNKKACSDLVFWISI
jgi:hypothetical protein